MAEFSEVSRAYVRMCESFGETCKGCPISACSGNDIGACKNIVLLNPEKYEDIIMQWAAEHPEPVYPTWGEWLCSLHVVGVYAMCAPKQNYYYVIDGKIDTPIPAYIAEKLGVEPKEAR